MPISLVSERAVWLGLSIAGLLLAPIQAAFSSVLPVVDGNVPMVMNSLEGSFEAPKRYIIGSGNNVTISWANDPVTIGISNSYIDLTIRNSAVFRTGAVSIGHGQVSSISALVMGSRTHWDGGTLFQVGLQGSESSLSIVDGARVTFAREGSGDVWIGRDKGANHNSVAISGSNSTLSGDGQLVVGYAGSSNALRIENGGAVDGRSLMLGRLFSGSKNSVMIMESGSVLRTHANQTSYVGEKGEENALSIQSGGRFISAGDVIVGEGAESNRNSMVISGAGSEMEISSQLGVGAQGSENLLWIGEGGSVTSASGFVGSEGDNNQVIITGKGSVWDNRGDLVIGGNEGSGNGVTVRDGALLRLDGALLINREEGRENFLRLDGGFFVWAGDQTEAIHSLLEEEIVQVWNGAAWECVVDVADFKCFYFLTDAEALAFTGYDGLGGSTILVSAIPEAQTGVLLALTGLVSAFHRHKTLSAKRRAG